MTRRWRVRALHAERLGGAEARSGGQGGAALLASRRWGKTVCRAHVGRAPDGRQGRAARAWHRFAGGPAAETVTKQSRVLVLKPWGRLRARVFEGARETLGEPPCVPAHTPPVCDAWCQGAPRGARRCAGLPLVVVGAPPCELECSVGGVILRAAGGKSVAGSREGQGMDGQEDEAGVLAPGKAAGPLVACEAEGAGCACELLAQRNPAMPPWLLGWARG